jgi:hypothetical protein
VQRAVSALERDQAAAQVTARSSKIWRCMLHEVGRLKADEPKRLMTYAREMELIEIFDVT